MHRDSDQITDEANLPKLRQVHSCQQPPKDEHFSYFEGLQQRLLVESDKLTTLIGVPKTIINPVNLKKDSNSGRKWTMDNQTAFSQLVNPTYPSSEKKTEARPTNSTMLRGLIQSSKQLRERVERYQSPNNRKIAYNALKNNSEIMPKSDTEISTPPTKSVRSIRSLPEDAQESIFRTSSTSSSSSSMNFQKTIQKAKELTISAKALRSSTGSASKQGLCFEDFQVLKYLEEGQFGTVHLARHKASNFLCALKKIAKSVFGGEMRFIEQLVREVKIQSFLDHPNIVQLYAFFHDEQNIYLVLQLCCDGNLYKHLCRSHHLPQQETGTLIRQVSHAIEYMHDADIIHRDIKPQNILLHQNIAKVCDFGWSIHSPLMRDTRCGTPLYSSPEVVQKRTYDNKVDVWNIGILTYELLYGRVPFEIRTQEDLQRVVEDEIYFPKATPISEIGRDFILQCLNKDPKRRTVMTRLIDHPFLGK